QVLRPLVLNLGHQHSKTRQRTLQACDEPAMGALLVCGSDDLDKILRELVLPQLINMVYDRTPMVRRELAGVLASLIEAGLSILTEEQLTESTGEPSSDMDCCTEDDGILGDEAGAGVGAGTGAKEGVGVGTGAPIGGQGGACLSPFRGRFVSLILMLQSDESREVNEAARKLLHTVGESWGKSNPSAVAAKLSNSSAGSASTEPGCSATAAPGPPPLPGPSRALCSSLLHEILPRTLEDSVHWKARDRHRAVQLLSCVTKYVGDDVTAHLPALLSTMGEASRDEEQGVRDAVAECASSIGVAVAHLSSITDILLPILGGKVSGLSGSQHLCEALTVLRPALSAAGPAKFKPLVGSVCKSLCSEALLSSEADEHLWEAVFMMCDMLVDRDLEEEMRREDTRIQTLRILLWLMAGCDRAGEDSQAVWDLVSRLAEMNACQCPQELFNQHFVELLQSALGAVPLGQGQVSTLSAAPTHHAEGGSRPDERSE
ncbi:unnamed protein product, partial [Discosporangium mesarthrocarpum]